MKKRSLSLVLAALLSITSLVGAKSKKDNLNSLEDLENYDDLKQSISTYQEKSVLEEASRVFEHRSCSEVTYQSLTRLLNSDITNNEKEIIKTFIKNNNIKDTDQTIKLPENTSVGYIVSNRINKCSVEVDVQFTKDNIPVLFHDRNLSRATNGIVTKKISDFTYNELSKIKIFYSQKNYSYIPTLDEILELHSNDSYYSILLEIKTYLVHDFLNNYKKAYVALKKTLTEVEDVDRTYLMSGDEFFILKHYHDFNKLGIKTGIAIFDSSFLREILLHFDNKHYDFISLNIEILNHNLILDAVKNKKALFIGSSSKKNIAKVTALYKKLNIYENFYVLTDYPSRCDDIVIEMEKQKQLMK